MAAILIMRLDAPLMSFGGAVVDNYGVTEEYPALSMITGLLANALGYHHGEIEKLERLQARIRVAARCDRPGERLLDYQTVDLGQDFMSDDLAWTTRCRVERRGGLFSGGTHIRYRHYLADSVYTVALCLDPPDESPTVGDLGGALKSPARPLFIGRKCCLPAAPVFVAITDASSPLTVLRSLPRIPDRTPDSSHSPLPAWWDEEDGGADGAASRLVIVTDERDWTNQVHTGRRFVRQGIIDPPEDDHECSR